MAPKRGATSASTQVSKKCKIVADGLAVSGIPDHCLEMLIGALDHSLGVSASERHQYQQGIVVQIGTLLTQAQDTIKAEVEARDAEVQAIETKIASMGETIESIKTDISAKEKVYDTKRAALAEVAKTFRLAKAKVQACENEQKEKDKESNAVIKKEAKLNTTLEEQLKPLSEKGAGEAGTAFSPVMAVLQEHGFENTMLEALPAAIEKKPEDRGDFDNMVVKTMMDEVTKKLSEMKEAIDTAEPAKKEREQAIQEAKAELAKASQVQIEHAQLFESAESDFKQAEELLSKTEGEQQSLNPALRKAKQVATRAKAKLTKFQEEPQATFEALATEKAPEEAAPEEAEVVDAAPEKADA